MTSNDNIYKNERNEHFMANRLISIRISDELLNDIDELTKSQGYSNNQEFIRAAAREKIQKEKIAQATLELKKLCGSAKGKNIRIASKDELDALARSLR
jgi:Arc/MetJ-type ribon-helix-helix transcriptional regulator